MLIPCPSCHRQLQVPDDAVARQVQCPGCQRVFAAASVSEQIQVAPSPRPRADALAPAPEDGRQPRRYERYADDDDVEDYAGEITREEDGPARQRAMAAALWFYVAACATLVLSTADTIKAFTIGEVANLPVAGPERSIVMMFMVAGMVVWGAILGALNVLIIIAGRKLGSFGAKAWVITGIVLAFIQVALFVGSALIEAITLIVSPRDAWANWTPLSIALEMIIGALNTVAAVKGIAALNDPGVRREFANCRQP